MKNTFLTLGLLASIGSAYASGLGVASDFNAFVFNNANLVGGESEGAVAVKGNFISSQAYNFALNSAAAGPISGSSNIGLYAGGNVNIASGNSAAGKLHLGNAFINGSVPGGNLQFQESGSGLVQGTVDLGVFSTAYTNLKALSQSLDALSGVNYSPNDMNNPTVDLAANTLNGDLKVFDVDASTLFGANPGTLNALNFTGTETIVFNVHGTGFNFNRSWQASGYSNADMASHTLWNFVDASSFSNSRQLEGAVLAVDSTFNQGDVVEGNLIVNNWNQSASREIHVPLFQGNLNPVPEPATIAVLGLGALAALRKRKQA